MRILIAEDDFASRKFMLKFLSKFGECDITVDGMHILWHLTLIHHTILCALTL